MINQIIKLIRNCVVFIFLSIILLACSDDPTSPAQKKDDLKTEVFDRWLITTECIESNGGIPIGTKQNEIWVINKVLDNPEEILFSVMLSTAKGKWTTSELYNYPHWVVAVSGYDKANDITVGAIYDITELSPMKGNLSVYLYVPTLKNWVLINRYSFIGNKQ